MTARSVGVAGPAEMGGLGWRGKCPPTPAPQIFAKQRQNLFHQKILYLLLVVVTPYIFRPSAGPGWWIAVKRQKDLQSRKYYDKNF